MITINQILRSSVVMEAMIYSKDEQPVYALLPDGTLHEIDSVGSGQITTSMGPSDVIVLAVNERTATEAT